MQNYQITKSPKLQSYKLQVHFCIFTSLQMLACTIINFQFAWFASLNPQNYKITDEKFQPTNNNVSKFTSNKTHACIAQNCKFASYKLK
jgi:hypothetical protein